MKNKYWKFAFFGLLLLALGSHVPTALQIGADPNWVQAIFEGINCLIGAITIGLVILGVRYQHKEIELQKQELEDIKKDRAEADKRERLKAWPALELKVLHFTHDFSKDADAILHYDMALANIGSLITNVVVEPKYIRPRSIITYEVLPQDIPSGQLFRFNMGVKLGTSETWTLTLKFQTLAGDSGKVRFDIRRDKMLKRWDDYPWQQAVL